MKTYGRVYIYNMTIFKHMVRYTSPYVVTSKNIYHMSYHMQEWYEFVPYVYIWHTIWHKLNHIQFYLNNLPYVTFILSYGKENGAKLQN